MPGRMQGRTARARCLAHGPDERTGGRRRVALSAALSAVLSAALSTCLSAAHVTATLAASVHFSGAV